ncbi:cysteine proteinase 1 [Selaginella moellendorffii]|uniref:cysteine proteinase 1 n=1 Tax=Selaginella moellendorffii TaxID=88036 RepID=UPI000D1CE1AA|nr:cysteine proteinase 1 [Selaginella moellendorffii]|eukprot:XP_024518115.1 cysteine proteinase 1 [Selaginella moellendorffii]
MFPCHRCRFHPSKVAATIANYLTVSEDEDQIAANLVKNGPLSTCPRICPGGDNMNHAVLLVGYGMDGDKPYWILKNSWSENYGEDGYFRLCRGFGVCGMNTRVSTVSA